MIKRFLAILAYFRSMPAPTSQSPSLVPTFLALEDFGALMARYQPMPLAKRALAVLHDAEPALKTCEQLLTELSGHAKIAQVFDAVRKNPALTGKMRPSEAKNVLMDTGSDFIASVLHKLGAWQKTLQRIGQGEGVAMQNDKEYISSDMPVAMALFSVNALDSYLAVIQLALMELEKTDAKNATQHKSSIAKIRRCATLLSDYDNASALRAVIH
jgi:hypothetical protein